jgi:pimeloyl-ACP methyl ester carboxylesterase
VDQTIGLASGHTVGFADYGIPDATAVLWCHGGPGSRLEPAYLRRAASEAGLRIIGIDRPGYGLSAQSIVGGLEVSHETHPASFQSDKTIFFRIGFISAER